MAYLIAAASSDGETIDRSFGAAEAFLIYEVTGPGTFHFAEKRPCPGNTAASSEACSGNRGAGGCGSASGSGAAKIGVISDCRSLLCAKIGFQAEKQLARQAISVFDVVCPIQEALDKITVYFDRVDRHQSLREFARDPQATDAEIDRRDGGS